MQGGKNLTAVRNGPPASFEMGMDARQHLLTVEKSRFFQIRVTKLSIYNKNMSFDELPF